jgi:hypothetical protein
MGATVAWSAVTLSMSVASYGQYEKVTWTEAVDYVSQHDSAFSFYGPVAMSLGLSNGMIVEYRVPSEASKGANLCFHADTWRPGREG